MSNSFAPSSWLATGHGDAANNPHHWPVYNEGQHGDNPRLRLVHSGWRSALWTLLGEFPVQAMAPLVRQQPLIGLELRLTEPLTEVQLQQLQQQPQLEFCSLPQGALLPQLHTVGLLVMDMDSTAIQVECIDELAAAAGVGAEVAAVTERAMQGELDFEQSLRARVAKLKGANANIISDLCQRLPLSPGLESMLAELQSHGWRTVLASGGFTPFVGYLQQRLSLDAAFANQLVIENGLLCGEVTGTIVDAGFKAATVQRCAREWHIAAGQTVAIGDGANDIPMVIAADLGIAYHGKPKLQAAADVVIRQLGLEVLPFWLQGEGDSTVR